MSNHKVDGHDDGEPNSPKGDDASRAPMAKNTYRKPVLAKHEQLHGIGLGS